MSHTHLSLTERYRISVYREQGLSIREIAVKVDRSASTVSRELRRNSPEIASYDPETAHQRAGERQRDRSTQSWKLTDRMYREIVGRLRRGDSPDIISGRSRREGRAMVSGEWIYQLIYRDQAADGVLWRDLASKRKRRKQRIRGCTERGQLLNRVMISERPSVVLSRERPGDWEGDSLVGQGNRSRLLSMVERQSRYLRLVRPGDRTSDATAEAIIRTLRREVLEILTVDNGKECARHEHIAQQLKTEVYFAEPYSSWQRGSNEHINGMVRRYFPKGTDFSQISNAKIKTVENRLNNRPRKLLGYATPWEVYSGRARPPSVAI